MKKQFINVFALASLSFVLASALVAQSTPAIRVNISHEFVAGGRTLPAGDYSIQSAGSLLKIGKIGGTAAVIVGTAPLQGEHGPKGKLDFNRYGDSYFLSQVWWPESDRGYELSSSKAERNLAKGYSAHTVQSVIVQH